MNFAAMFVAFMMVFFYLGLEIFFKGLMDMIRKNLWNQTVSPDEKIMFVGTEYAMTHKEFITHMWRPMLLVSFLGLDFMLYGMEGTPAEIQATYTTNIGTYNSNASLPSNFTAAQYAAVPGIHSGTAWIIHGVCFFLSLTYVLPDDFKRGAYFIAVAFMYEWVGAYILTTVVVYSPVGSAFDKRAIPGCIVLGFIMSTMALMTVTGLSGMARCCPRRIYGEPAKNFLDILPVPKEESKEAMKERADRLDALVNPKTKMGEMMVDA